MVATGTFACAPGRICPRRRRPDRSLPYRPTFERLHSEKGENDQISTLQLHQILSTLLYLLLIGLGPKNQTKGCLIEWMVPFHGRVLLAMAQRIIKDQLFCTPYRAETIGLIPVGRLIGANGQIDFVRIRILLEQMVDGYDGIPWGQCYFAPESTTMHGKVDSRIEFLINRRNLRIIVWLDLLGEHIEMGESLQNGIDARLGVRHFVCFGSMFLVQPKPRSLPTWKLDSKFKVLPASLLFFPNGY